MFDGQEQRRESDQESDDAQARRESPNRMSARNSEGREHSAAAAAESVFRMVIVVSGSGVTMTIKDTPRNARNVLVGWLHSSRLVAYEINSYRLDPSMTSLHSTIPNRVAMANGNPFPLRGRSGGLKGRTGVSDRYGRASSLCWGLWVTAALGPGLCGLATASGAGRLTLFGLFPETVGVDFLLNFLSEKANSC